MIFNLQPIIRGAYRSEGIYRAWWSITKPNRNRTQLVIIVNLDVDESPNLKWDGELEQKEEELVDL